MLRGYRVIDILRSEKFVRRKGLVRSEEGGVCRVDGRLLLRARLLLVSETTGGKTKAGGSVLEDEIRSMAG